MDSALESQIVATVGSSLAVRGDGAPAVFDTKLPDGYSVTDPVIVALEISDMPTIDIDSTISIREQRITLEVQASSLIAARQVKALLISGLQGWSGGQIASLQFESGGPTLYTADTVPPRYCLPVDFMVMM